MKYTDNVNIKYTETASVIDVSFSRPTVGAKMASICSKLAAIVSGSTAERAAEKQRSRKLTVRNKTKTHLIEKKSNQELTIK